MKQRVRFLLRYLLFWMAYFTASRLLFMLYQYKLSATISIKEFFKIIVHGCWMDLSMTSYIVMLVCLIVAGLCFASTEVHIKTFKHLTLTLLSIISLIIVADLELYRNWLFRIDATPLLYLKNPKEAMASTPIWSTILLLLLAAGYTWIWFSLYIKLVNSTLNKFRRGNWWTIPSLIVIAGCMVLPIRGGIGIAPMNPGKVYFSQNVYCNHAALNAIWNMLYACTQTNDINHRYPDTVSAEVAEPEFAKLLSYSHDSTRYILKTQRPNIVLILLESFTAKAIEAQGGMEGITPNLNMLSEQGINFTNVYSASDRSDKGIVSVLSGFPAQPLNSIIKYPSKSAKLPSISKSLSEQGYYTTFYYGGDPTFASINSFIYGQKFSKIVSQDEFPTKYRNSKWGVHDEYVFTRLLNDIDSSRTPFFKLFFTLTSHEPYETPAPSKIKGDSEEHKFLNSMNYTDSCLGNFFEQARTRDWYQNTLFVLIADHGHRLPHNSPNYVLPKFRIPMVWLGGALNCQPFEEHSVCCQFDLATTLLVQLGIETNEFNFSKDVLNPTSQQFGYYVFNNGYGFITPTDTLIHDQTSNKDIINTSDSLTTKSGAFYRIYQDYFLGL